MEANKNPQQPSLPREEENTSGSYLHWHDSVRQMWEANLPQPESEGCNNCDGSGWDGRYHCGCGGDLNAPSPATLSSKDLIEFATWYSGMDKEKVERAYARYLNEIKQQQQTR